MPDICWLSPLCEEMIFGLGWLKLAIRLLSYNLSIFPVDLESSGKRKEMLGAILF